VPFQNLTLLLRVSESNAVHVKCFLTFLVSVLQHHRLPHRPRGLDCPSTLSWVSA
jgi:hypothetical protein